MRSLRIVARFALRTGLLMMVVGCADPPVDGSDPVSTVCVADGLSIGSVDGSREVTFGFVVDADILSDGSVAIADRSANVLRVFSPEGEFRTEMGRSGAGPGEFRYLESFEVKDDTLIASDPRTGRTTRFSVEGGFISTARTPVPLGSLIGITSDGRTVWRHSMEIGERAAGWAEAVEKISFADLGHVSLVTNFVSSWRGERPYPTSPIASVALIDDSLLVSDPSTGLIHVLDLADGTGREILVSTPHVDRDEAWAAIRRELLERDLGHLALELDDTPPKPLPRFGQVLVSGDDEIWVKLYDPLEDAHWLGGWAGGEGGVYWVLNRDGEMIRRVELCDRVVPLAIRGNKLLGRYRDDLDVQYVVILPI